MDPVHDLHLHSTASDGSLSPAALVRAAHGQGVTALALTDHDTTAGLAEAADAARELGIRFIPGVELSASWERKTLHVVGLNIAPNTPVLREGLARHAAERARRAQLIARRLASAGLPGLLEQARTYGAGMVTRAHFARALCDLGHVKTPADAFRRYLGRGKPAHVSGRWAGLAEAVGWIRAAGGVAVLAHPLRYKLTRSWLQRLLLAFKAAGGGALEIVGGNSTPQEIRTLTGHALRQGLAGSVGSDYHGPEMAWSRPGRLLPLPAAVTPVWALW